jgi:hypothetical protein
MPYNTDHEWYDEPVPAWRLDANGNWLAPDGSLSDVVTAYASDPEYVKSILGATYGQNTNPSFQNPYASSEQAKYNQAINTLQNAGINVTNDPLFQSNAQEQLSYNYSPFMNADAPTHSPVNQIVQGLALAALGGVASPEIFGALGGTSAPVVGGSVAGDAFMPSSLAYTDPSVASNITSELAGKGAVASGEGASGAGFGSGTSLSADSATNPLNPFYGTSNPAAQANLVGSNLVGGGAEANLGLLGGNSLVPVSGAGIGGAELGATGGIIGSGAGLGQSTVPYLTGAAGLNGFTPNDFMSQPITNDLIDKIKLPSSSTNKTPQQNMANILRLPTNLSTNVTVKPLENPFLTNNQQVLANMLKV